MFDVHSHLTDSAFEGSLEQLLTDAASAGVEDIMVVAEDLTDAAKVLSLPAVLGGVRLHRAIGMHPEKADLGALPAMLDLIRSHASQLACVGEIGLDYSPHVVGGEGKAAEEEVKAVQQQVMREQVRLAQELGMAVNVHSRGAGHHALSLLEEEGARRVVMHAFDGKAQYAERGAVSLGFHFSVPPCVARSPLMAKMVKRLPLDRLLLETDAPALAAEKGAVNVPAGLCVSCAKVAEIKGLQAEVVKEATTGNARQLFFLHSDGGGARDSRGDGSSSGGSGDYSNSSSGCSNSNRSEQDPK